MPKGRGVKVKKIQKNVIDNEQLNEIIAQLVGQDRDSETVHNAKIIYDHYCELESLCFEYIDVMIKFNKHFFERTPAYLKSVQTKITNYVNKFIKQFNELFKLEKRNYAKIDMLDLDPRAIDLELLKELRNIGYDARDSNLCKELVITCGKMKDLGLFKLAPEEIIQKLKGMSMVSFNPFPNCDVDIKYLIDNSGIDDACMKILGQLLYDVNSIGFKVYEVIGTPCVDLDRLIGMIMEQFTMFKKELRDCDEAFKLIEKSTHLFKDNFRLYYRRFRASGDQTSIILEEYLNDVITAAGNDPKTVRQVKKLMLFVRKKIAEKTKQAGPPPAHCEQMFNNLNKEVDRFVDILGKLDMDKTAGEGEVAEGEMMDGDNIISNITDMLGGALNMGESSESEKKESKNARRKRQRKEFRDPN